MEESRMSQTTLVGWLLAGGGPEQTFPSSGLCSAGPTQSGLVMCSVAHQLNQLERKLNKTNLAISFLQPGCTFP